MQQRKMLIGLLVLSAALPLASCGGKQADDPTGANAASRLTGPHMIVTMSEMPDWQAVSAEITSLDQAQVMARMPGVLSSLTVRAGDSVRKGQVIGRISDTAGGGASAQSAAASAQAGLAQADLSRVRFLYQNGVYAKARLEQAEAMARIANAQASGMRAAEAVIAPATGRVLHADVPTGSPVGPGTLLAVVTSGPVILRLEVPETLATRIIPGARVMVDGMTGEGTVSRIYPAVTVGQVAVDAAMVGLDPKLIGRRLPARVAAGTRKALLVPRVFVSTRYGLDYMTVIDRNGAATQVPVQTVAADEGRIEILSGLSVGDTVVDAR